MATLIYWTRNIRTREVRSLSVSTLEVYLFPRYKLICFHEALVISHMLETSRVSRPVSLPDQKSRVRKGLEVA